MAPPAPPTTLTLLRALLRECTYLPDPLARTHWHARILTRFRLYHPRKPTLPWWLRPRSPRRRTTPVTSTQRAHLLHQARQLLSTLARANAGHMRPLEHVLLHTYGRAGKRRHELLAALEKLDAPSDTDAVRRLAASLAENTTEDGSGSPALLPPTVSLVVKAQRAQPGARLSRTAMKTLRPAGAVANVWGRAVPVRRARNAERRWVARARASVLPPLPRGEWERLRDLAAGRREWGGVVPRRGKGGRGVGRVGGENPHALTPRFMRRLWERVFVQCPVMEWDGEAGAWGVRWGKVERGGRGRSVAGRVNDTMFLFEGVDEDGRRLEPR
ncbi:hypothetical protein MMC17_001773 [Xylographa soralifera]|nr:hypothetical protein [Xylographa soralifera]